MSYAAKGEKVFDWQGLDCTPPLKRSDHRLKRFSSTSDRRAWHQCEDIRYRHMYDMMSGSRTCMNIDQSHKYIPLDDLIKIIMAEKDELIKQLQEELRRCQSQGVIYTGNKELTQSRVPGISDSRDKAPLQSPVGGVSDNRDKASVQNRMVGVSDYKDTTLVQNRVGDMSGDKDKASLQNRDEDVGFGEDKELLQGRIPGVSYSEDKESLQSRVAELTEELNKSRNMLRQAMQKLQNIDEIVNENKKLQCRLRCSEERIKYLEEKKRHLESELADLRSKSQIQIDLERAKQMLTSVTQRREESTEMDEVALESLTIERDELQDKVKKLEKELEDSKKKETEIEMLKKQSQSDSLDKEEMSRENECYRKKLASMKCLEKQIQELKKQGRALADKYKREAQKAAEQMSKMDQAAKELQSLRDERDSLRKRVNELVSYECQYNTLQRKLQRVDAVIAENESLNSKLLVLQNLEKENEYLRCRLEAVQEMETSATEDKERILQLQCAVADQEEEMKDLLCQIERLTSGKHEEELERLKCELYEKNSKLKLCEEQLAEIPMLEAEIDELRLKLQCCCREFADKKTGENSYQKIEVRLPATSKGIHANYKNPKERCSSVLGTRREEPVAFKSKPDDCQDIMQAQKKRAYNATPELSEMKDKMSCEEVQCLLQSSKGIISCVLEDMIEHQKEMEELERCNKAMKKEIDALKEKVGGSDTSVLLEEINKLKKCLRSKDLEISRLQSHSAENGEDIETLRNLNKEMKCELDGRDNSKGSLREENPVEFKSTSDISPSGSRKVSLTRESEFSKALQKETNELKLQIEALNKLTDELKKENELLRELQKPGPDFSKQLDEKCALENLISLLQAELDSFKGQKLGNECEALRKELKRVMDQNCDLKTLVNCYRQRLNLEKKSNELKSEANFSQNKDMKSLEGNVSKSQDDDGNLENWLNEGARNEDDNEIPDKEKREPESGTPGSEVSGSGMPGDEILGSGVAVSGMPGSEMAGGGMAGSGMPGSEMAGSGMAGSGMPGSEMAGSGMPGSEMAGSGMPGSEMAGSEMAGSGMTGSGVPGSGMTGSGVAGSGMAESGVAGSLMTESGMAGSGVPGSGMTGSGVPGSGMAGSGVPGSGVPGSGMTGSGVPGSGMTGSGVPGSGMAGSGMAGSGVPGSGMAGSGMAGSGVPGSGMAGSGVTGSGMAGRGVPGSGMPGSSEANEMLPADCYKELERLRKENNDLIKQLEAKSPTIDGEVAKLQEKLRQMEAENADKLKKLMDQQKKELENREKIYNENLNAMKSGYETGIRKLSERHKQSVSRLQELHQDEVQEMNSNYEAQLDTMQTQSEAAINDITQSSAAKIRKLVAKHSKEIGELRDSLSKSAKELETLKKQGKWPSDKNSNNELKMQQARLMQKMRRTSQQKLSAMKMKFEESKLKLEEETDALKNKLREHVKGKGICECAFAKKKLRKTRDPSCPLDFNEVLEKILEEGLDSLTFNEIALVHRKTCCALEGIVMKSNSSSVLKLEPHVKDSCPHTPLLEADKQQLLNRIFALENEILQKQKQTQDAIISMEVAIKKERCRLQEVRNSLENEQLKNSKLKSLLSSQTKVQSDLKRERDRLGNEASMHQMLCQERTKQLDEEVKTKKCLEIEISKLKNDLKHLCAALDAERGKCSPMRRDKVEQMRAKLEQSMQQDRRLALQLEKETKTQESPTQALKQSFRQMVTLPAMGNDIGFSQNPLEAKSAKERQNLDQIKEKKNKIKTKCKKQKK